MADAHANFLSVIDRLYKKAKVTEVNGQTHTARKGRFLVNETRDNDAGHDEGQIEVGFYVMKKIGVNSLANGCLNKDEESGGIKIGIKSNCLSLMGLMNVGDDDTYVECLVQLWFAATDINIVLVELNKLSDRGLINEVNVTQPAAA